MPITTRGEEITTKELVSHLETLSLEKLWEICKKAPEGSPVEIESYKLIVPREARKAQENFRWRKPYW